MSPASAAVRLTDFEPEVDDFAEDVRRGLAATPKQLHPKYFYDAAGSKLFDRICATSEYYPTRTEIAIMERFAGAMAALAALRAPIDRFFEEAADDREKLLKRFGKDCVGRD